MRVVYADTLFITNFIMNYFILLATAKICDAPAKRRRLAAAAALGGGYAVAAAIPAAGFLEAPAVKIAAGVLLALCAFGGRAGFARAALVFFAVSATAAGAALAVSLLGGGELFAPVSLKILLPSFAVCYAAVTLVFRRAARRTGGTVSVTLRLSGRETRLRALLDNGNSLRDPVTGKRVLVAGLGDLTPLFPRGAREAIADAVRLGAVRAMEALGDGEVRFRLIPYSSVGVEGGLLLAFRPDAAEIGGERRDGLLVAISPNSVSDNGTYSALMGA
ncbi:MAG: sigma-E processing peptidase SpoIIGA [Oscillospiraceae bacterium]|jgi:stage II sporulation protein GA (sporulation sigma-E factor processing peptidase)|nr:sigma-E processing peptidase SpoIIGA [Oscillospiraceae bacterium]